MGEKGEGQIHAQERNMQEWVVSESSNSFSMCKFPPIYLVEWCAWLTNTYFPFWARQAFLSGSFHALYSMET